MLYFVVCMLQINRDQNGNKSPLMGCKESNQTNKQTSPYYIMLKFVLCMLQIDRDQKDNQSLLMGRKESNQTNKSLYDSIVCSLYVSNRSIPKR